MLNSKSLVSLSSDLQFKISRELQTFDMSVLNLPVLNLSACYGIWGKFRANTLCYFAHRCYFADLCRSLQIFADLCRSLLLCRSDFPEAALQVPAFSKHLTERMPIKLYDVKNHYYDGHPKTIFLFKKAKIALVDIWPPLKE